MKDFRNIRTFGIYEPCLYGAMRFAIITKLWLECQNARSYSYMRRFDAAEENTRQIKAVAGARQRADEGGSHEYSMS